ncbi:hypothetical protein DHEL01_v209234 [Diaporthe helianthi]|uniref:Uncharacterized protein n=1 Tax=Diaporthe helianthi TaxID=158607 RepID=A0A2P5HQ57_DIAHE|nr:hypothetical protein DHEL01_v209234 [Diaporthe helianthi]
MSLTQDFSPTRTASTRRSTSGCTRSSAGGNRDRPLHGQLCQ